MVVAAAEIGMKGLRSVSDERVLSADFSAEKVWEIVMQEGKHGKPQEGQFHYQYNYEQLVDFHLFNREA